MQQSLFFTLPKAESKVKVDTKLGFEVFFLGCGKLDVKMEQTTYFFNAYSELLFSLQKCDMCADV